MKNVPTLIQDSLRHSKGASHTSRRILTDGFHHKAQLDPKHLKTKCMIALHYYHGSELFKIRPLLLKNLIMVNNVFVWII